MCSSHTHGPGVTTNKKRFGGNNISNNQGSISSNIHNTLTKNKPIENSVKKYLGDHEIATYERLSSAADRYNYIAGNVTKAFTDQMSNAYATGDSQLFHILGEQMTTMLTTIRNEIYGA